MDRPINSRSYLEAATRYLNSNLAIFIFYLIITIWRRPSQFLNPYVWDEDGTQIIPNVIENGIFAIFVPVNGYLNASASLINYLSLKLSFMYQPFFSYWLTLAFTFVLIIQIARNSQHNWVSYLVLAVIMLVPSNPEVYGVGLYSFWLIGAYSFLLMWKVLQSNYKIGALDCILLPMALISSPFSWALFPFFLVILLFRNLAGLKSIWLWLSIIAFLTQAYFVSSSLSHQSNSKFWSEFSTNLLAIVPVFFGNFINSGASEATRIVLGYALVANLLVLQYFAFKTNWKAALFILLCGMIAVFLSWYRVPITVITPSLAGPRYFFYPYLVILTYLLLLPLNINSDRKGIFVAYNIAIAVIAIGLNSGIMQRKNHILDWSVQANLCTQSDHEYKFTVFFNGYLNNSWQLNLSPQTCSELIKNSVFDEGILLTDFEMLKNMNFQK